MGHQKSRPPRHEFSNQSINGLLPLLQWLDQQLERSIALTNSNVDKSPYRGLIQPDRAEVEQLLTRTPGAPSRVSQATDAVADLAALVEQLEPDSPIVWLRQTFELSEFDIAVVAIALAPELDPRYEQVYSHLQDDVRCQRPTVDLALNLLCSSAHEKLIRRVHFSTDAPLIFHRLLYCSVRSDQHQPTLLKHELHLDHQITHWVLGQTGLDPRLTDYCKLIQPQASSIPLPLPPRTWQNLAALTSHYWQSDRPLRLHFKGPDTITKQRTAEALANAAQTRLLTVDLGAIAASKADVPTILAIIYREAWLQNVWLYFNSLESLVKEETTTAYHCFLTELSEHLGIVILAGSQPWHPTHAQPLGVFAIAFPLPSFEQRRACWQTHLTAAEITLDAADLDALSDRFRLTTYQIADAVTTACNTAHWQAICAPDSQATQSTVDLFAAARLQSSHDLAALARKIEPRYGWDDLVLPEDTELQLQEIAVQAKNRSRVYRDWGFDTKLSLGKGLNALFSGPPGTGKTMAAEVIANTVQLDLYKIDLSQVVSKYIGETEKSLNRIFTAAENSNAILLFDEADALFGKRSEVRDAHDRYANIETSYLLQKMEEYDGIAILTTNLRSNMDEAFTRRLRFIIDFPIPSAVERCQIWKQVWPPATPLDPDLDWDFLAQQFEITGANIRNIALMAAFLAADESNRVQMAHVLRAIRREYQKMGKLLIAEEW